MFINPNEYMSKRMSQFIQRYIHDQGVKWIIYVSKCSTSIQIPYVKTELTKHIKAAALGHKMWQFINRFLQRYVLVIFLFT